MATRRELAQSNRDQERFQRELEEIKSLTEVCQLFMSLTLWGEGHTDFGADPVGIGVGMTLYCLHKIL